MLHKFPRRVQAAVALSAGGALAQILSSRPAEGDFNLGQLGGLPRRIRSVGSWN